MSAIENFSVVSVGSQSYVIFKNGSKGKASLFCGKYAFHGDKFVQVKQYEKHRPIQFKIDLSFARRCVDTYTAFGSHPPVMQIASVPSPVIEEFSCFLLKRVQGKLIAVEQVSYTQVSGRLLLQMRDKKKSKSVWTTITTSTCREDNFYDSRRQLLKFLKRGGYKWPASAQFRIKIEVTVNSSEIVEQIDIKKL